MCSDRPLLERDPLFVNSFVREHLQQATTKSRILGGRLHIHTGELSVLCNYFLSRSGFIAYLGFINVLVAHSHPVMLMFCQLLINRDKDRGSEQAPQKTQHCIPPYSSMVTGSASGM